MIASRRANLKLTLYLCFALLAGLCAWLAIVLLSQLALMEPVTAPAAQSLAGNDGALQFVAAAGAADAGSSYASARLWVWFCIGANSAGAVLAGLWLRAVMIAPAAPVRRMPAAPPALCSSLVERAMQARPAPLACSAAATAAARAPVRTLPAPGASGASAGAGEASARLARLARIIDTLAFQTTLLAVNAAVEAERGSRLPPRA